MSHIRPRRFRPAVGRSVATRRWTPMHPDRPGEQNGNSPQKTPRRWGGSRKSAIGNRQSAITAGLLAWAAALTGCSPTVLSPSSPPPLPPLSLERIALPCRVAVRHSDAAVGMGDRRGGSPEFALKPVLERAFRDAAGELFHKPRAEAVSCFAIEVVSQAAELRTAVGAASSHLQLTVSLRSPFGDTMSTETIEGQARSGYDRASVPPAVWKAAYDAACRYMADLSQRPAVREEQQKYLEQLRNEREIRAPEDFQVITDRRPVGKKIAIVVGVSQYAHADPQQGFSGLRFAHCDAQAMAGLLRSPAAAFDRVVLLTDGEATLEGIRGAIRANAATAPDDLVVVFFSGHGVRDPFPPQRFYFLPHDGDPRKLRETAYPLEEMTARVAAGRLIVFLDTCHGGSVTNTKDIKVVGIDRGKTTTRAIGGMKPAQNYLPPVDHARSLNTLILASCQQDEVSHEGPQWALPRGSGTNGSGHGVFTWALLQGLGGEADQDRDGAFLPHEICTFVCETVRKATHGGQNPVKYGTADRSVVLARTAAAARAASR